MIDTQLRADHCGSFIRPEGLRRARVDRLRGRIDDTALEAVEDDAIREVLELQRSVGLDIYSDGEFRRAFWKSAVSPEFFEGIESEGFNRQQYPELSDADLESRAEFVPANPIITGKLKLKKPIAADEIAFLKKMSPGRYKITVPSPVTLRRGIDPKNIDRRVYPGWISLAQDYTDILVGEIASMASAGVPYIQLDAPGYTDFFVPEKVKRMRDFGVDIERELSALVEADNRCLRAARAPGVTVGVHICLGTYILGPQGPLGGGGDYDAGLLGRLVSALDADRFLIEFSERSGAVETLSAMPKDKVIVLGILNIRDPRVETIDEIRRKVDAAAAYVPIERLAISPNCGFSGASAGAFVDETVQRRKLEVMVEAADRIWN